MKAITSYKPQSMISGKDTKRRRVSIVTSISLLFLVLASTNLAVTWVFSGANQMRLISEKAYWRGSSIASEILLRLNNGFKGMGSPHRFMMTMRRQPDMLRKEFRELHERMPEVPVNFQVISTDYTRIVSEPRHVRNPISSQDAQNLLKALQLRDLHHQPFLGVPDIRSNSIRLYIPITVGGVNDLVLVTQVILSDLASDLKSVTRLIVATIIILLAIQVVIGFVIYRLLIRPLRKVSLAALEIGEGKFISVSVPQRQNDEILALVEAFNRMSSDLKAKDEMIKSQMHDLSQKNATLDFELEIAERIQRSVLPESERWRGLNVVYEPLHRVSGDFYDLAQFSDGSVGVLVADASGHGVPAAFLTILLKVLFGSLSTHISDPSRLMLAINQQMCRYLGYSGFYLTAFYIHFSANGEASYCNCGHPAAWKISDEGILTELPSMNNVIGLIDEITHFDTAAVKFDAGDSLFIYSDGLSEQMNPEGQLIDTEMLKRHLLNGKKDDKSALLSGLLRLTETHRAGESLKDDLTCVLIEPRELVQQSNAQGAIARRPRDEYMQLLTRLHEMSSSPAICAILVAEHFKEGDISHAHQVLVEAMSRFPGSRALLRLQQKISGYAAVKVQE